MKQLEAPKANANLGGGSTRNDTNQLNGVITDLLLIWQNSQFQNTTSGVNNIHLNSQKTTLGNDLNQIGIKTKIKGEFEFFDKFYWK